MKDDQNCFILSKEAYEAADISFPLAQNIYQAVGSLVDIAQRDLLPSVLPSCHPLCVDGWSGMKEADPSYGPEIQ